MEQNEEILYKYRSIENFKNFVDIILNNRLYAASYKDLNDPQEGQYYYSNGILQKNIKDKLYEQKNSYKICSLSKTKNNQLMWSHYANGNHGVAIGVKVIDQNAIKRTIKYSGLSTLRSLDYINQTAINILTHKHEIWTYENEIRFFKENHNYIDVEIYEIILGSQMNGFNKNIVTKLIEKINPNIQILQEDPAN